MRKSTFSILIIVLVAGAMGIWLFFSNAILNFMDDTEYFHPSKKPIMVSTGAEEAVIKGESGAWDPAIIRAQEPISTKSGVTITVSTNGPPVRSMTPEEQAAFQKQIQEN